MLGDTRADLVSLLAIALGKAGAEKAVTDLETTVRTAAVDGTNSALDAKLPNILAQVRDQADQKTKALFYGAVGAGVVGIFFGFAATRRAKKCVRG